MQQLLSILIHSLNRSLTDAWIFDLYVCLTLLPQRVLIIKMSSETATDKLQQSALMEDSDLMGKHQVHVEQHSEKASGTEQTGGAKEGAPAHGGQPQDDAKSAKPIHEADSKLGSAAKNVE
jgi:hypothetical protein